MQLAITFATIALSIALGTNASPIYPAADLSARASDNGYCKQLLTICSQSSSALTNPWSTKACLFGAGCFGGQRPVDGFLSAVAAAKHASSAPASHDAPRVSQSTFKSISTNGNVITQQNYIDGVYSTLATTNGPFPDVSFVINDFNRLATWTAFCNGQGIPFKNFADYYQFSATVNSPGCSSVTSTIVHPVTTTPPARPTSTLIPTTGAPTSTRLPVPPIGASDSCGKMLSTCTAQVNKAVSDAWSHPACLFAAVCFGGQRPVDGLLATVFASKNGSGAAPTSVKETRLSTTTMKSISTDGKSITQQNWIDGYYGLLSSVGGPFPTSANGVISDFQRLRAWTGFCSGGIPFKNVADYFQFSSSVSSNTSC